MCSYNIAEEIIDQPLPGRILSPIGTPVQLNCMVRERCTAVWQVMFPDSDLVLSSSDTVTGLPELMRRGLQLQSQSPNMSQLIFNVSSQLQATVRCFSVCPAITFGNTTEVNIYGV